MYNDRNTDVERAVYLPGFAIFSVGGTKINKGLIASWDKNVEKKRNFQKCFEDAKIDCKIVCLNVTGGLYGVKVNGQNTIIRYIQIVCLSEIFIMDEKIKLNHTMHINAITTYKNRFLQTTKSVINMLVEKIRFNAKKDSQ